MIGYLTQNHPLIQAFTAAPARRTRRAAGTAPRLIRLAPRLADSLPDAGITAVRGPLDRPVSGLALDSRRVVPGAVFFALPGRRTDGLRFLDEAVSRGAVAIVAPRLPAVPPARVTCIQVADARAALAAAAQRFYRHPDRDLTVVGVTGTHGKTTTAHLLQHLLNGDRRVGLLSSIRYDLGVRSVPALLTTPEALDTFGLLAQMRDAGCRHAVLEVSSHGLAQQRVRGVQWGAAIFTNLAAEHLDYHGSAEAYRAAKRQLFTGGTGRVPAISVVNLDDAAGRALAAELAAEVAGTRVITYGEDAAAQVRAERIEQAGWGTRFRLVWPGGVLDVEWPLPGRFNVSNLLAAVAAAWGLGRDPLVMLARLRAFRGVPGRLEAIDEGQDFRVVVDGAHTAGALRQALGVLRAQTVGRLIVVFGCGGQGDRPGRPRLARVVEEQADLAIATAANPRTEALGRIFGDLRAGLVAPERFAWIEDRRQAIAAAFARARPGDCVLLAGKGHESRQELADTVFPFDDRLVARELLRSRSPAEA